MKLNKKNIELHNLMNQIGIKSKRSQIKIANSSHLKRNKVLLKFSELIEIKKDDLIRANKMDIAQAKQRGVRDSYLDRLELNDQRISSMSEQIQNICSFDDPLNKTLSSWVRPNGLKISRLSVPLGVLGIIYESRPNVTADASALAIKSGNSVILRCGSDSFNSCNFLVNLVREALNDNELSEDVIQLVPTKNREAVGYMLRMSELIDVIIPRGGRSLVEKVQNEARIPVFSHLEGICHIYVDKSANFDKSISVVLNGKMRRTGICGATETLLIDESIAESFLPLVGDVLEKNGCKLVGDSKARLIVPSIGLASEKDWVTEYLAPILSVKIVDGLDEAIEHIRKYGSNHTDAIMTEDKKTAENFTTLVDSAIVMVNASTQFADGAEFGLGAEIGISTGRLHARGPVGVDQLTSFKYVVYGSGQTRP